MCIPFSLEYKQADIFPKCDTRRRTAAVFPHSGGLLDAVQFVDLTIGK